MTPEELVRRIRLHHPDVFAARGEVTLTVAPDRLLEALEELRSDPELAFDMLCDLTATDWPGAEPRIWLAYELLSTTANHRLRVKVGLTGAVERPHCPSVTGLHPAANWYERETYDFYGVIFDGHPDLRRIELPEEWETHPMRKDHPLAGVRTAYKGAFIPPPDERGL